MGKWMVGLAIVVAFVAGGFLATKLSEDDTTATQDDSEDVDGDTSADGASTDATGDGTTDETTDPGTTDATGTDPANPDGTGLQTIPGNPTAVTNPVSTEPLLLRSMGPIVIGMTVGEAQTAIGGSIINETNFDGPCNYGTIYGDPDSPGLMVISEDDFAWEDSRIERIDVTAASETRSGIHIGSTTDEVYAAYGDAIVATPHPYDASPGSFYLTYVPSDPNDADYRLIMETSGNVVTEIRTGFTQTAEQIEGCS